MGSPCSLPGVLLGLAALVVGVLPDDADVDDLPGRLHRHRLQLPQRVRELVRLVLSVVLARLRGRFIVRLFWVLWWEIFSHWSQVFEIFGSII